MTRNNVRICKAATPWHYWNVKTGKDCGLPSKAGISPAMPCPKHNVWLGKAERLEEMIRLRDKENMTLAEIGERVGLSKQAVAQNLGKVGRRENTSRKIRLIEMTAAGCTPAQMAEALGIKVSAIYSSLKYYGIEIKKEAHATISSDKV